MSKDNLSSLYNGLLSKGYTVKDLGDENRFREKMSDKNNRKKLYDYVSSRGNFRIGDYDTYEQRLSSEFDTIPEKEEQETIQIPQQNTEETEISVQVPQSEKLPVLERKSLKEQAGSEIAVPNEMEMAAKFAQQPVMYDPNVRLQTAKAKGQLDTIIQQDEEREIDTMFTPKPVLEAADIYKNYKDRFALTERGKELNTELADISRNVQEKYVNQFLRSPEYKALQEQYSGQELDRRANEAFQKTYSGQIEKEIEPYSKAYQGEAFSRYQADINRDMETYANKQKQETKDKIATDVDRLNASIAEKLTETDRKLSNRSGQGGNAFNALMGSTQYNVASASERKEKGELEAAQSLVNESQHIIDEAKKKGSTNFMAGLGRGFADTAFDPETWSFGLADMREGKLLLDALNKFDSGKQLTESEQMLMDAAVANMATNAYFYSDLGRGYKAGMTSGQSVPFMLEFAVNPVSASGSTIAKSILKYGMNRFGKQAAKKGISKFVARLTGDALAAAGMTGTSSAARVASGALERQIGDIQLDDTGTIYAGRINKQTGGESLGKSFASTFLENQSEMIFNAFKGLGPKIWGAVEKHVPGGTASVMDNALLGKAGELYRKIKATPVLAEAAKRTQFHGIGEEYLEEVYNNFANIPLGEMTLEEATDLDNNIDTFLGLAPTSVAFGVLGLGGLANEKYQHRKRMKAAFGDMTKIERERLSKLESLAESGNNDDIKQFIKQTISDTSLSPEEKKAEIAYAYNIAVGNAIDELENEQGRELEENHAAAVTEGNVIYQEHNPLTMRQTVLRREVSREHLADAGMSEQDIDNLGNVPVEERQKLLDHYDEGIRNAATDYLNALDREKALNEALDIAHEQEVKDAQALLQEIVLPNNTVTVVPLGRYATEQAQYGVVVNGIDANGVPTQSNGAVMVLPVQVENGKLVFAGIDTENAMSVVPDSYTQAMVFSPDEALESMLQAYSDDADILDGTPIAPGASFPIMMDDGSMQDVSVAGNDGAGRVAVILPDGKPTYIDETELAKRKRDAEIAPIIQEYADAETVQQEAAQEASTIGYSPEVRSLQPNPGDKLVVSGRNAVIKEVSPDGLIVDYLDEAGEIAGTDLIPVETYYDYKQSQFEKLGDGKASGEDNQENAPIVDGSGTETGGEHTEQMLETSQEYPTDENGEPLFLQMQPEQTVSLLTSMLEEDAFDFVSQKLLESEKAAKKAAEKSPKKTSFVERVKELEQIKRERNDAAEAVSYWKNIAGMIQPPVSSIVSSSKKPQQAISIQEQAKQETEANQKRLEGMAAEEQAAAQAKVQENINKGKYERNDTLRKRTRNEYESRRNEGEGAEGTEQPADNAGSNDVLPRQETDNKGTTEEQPKPERETENSEQGSGMVSEQSGAGEIKNSEIETNGRGYTIEKRYHAKQEKDIYAVNFTERMGREDFLSAKKKAKDMGGYYSSFGKGGFIFNTEDEAQVFAESITGQDISGNGDNSVTLQTQTNNLSEDEHGKMESLSGEGSRINEENAAESVLRKTGNRTATQDGQGSRAKESLLGELAEKTSGSPQWINDIETIISSPIGRGGENEVYLSGDKKKVIKVNDFSYLPDNSTNFDSFMNRVDAHNELFPDDAITILGFTRNSEGKISVVLSQPYISNAREATQEEIDGFLEDMDFYTDMSGNWTDGTFDIADTKPNNVLVDADGNLHFIDVLPYDSRKPGKMLEIPITRKSFAAPEPKKDESVLDYAQRVSKAYEKDKMRRQIDVNPTDAQKEAGNYKKGHVKLDGYDITIENPKGSERKGTDKNGTPWSVTMNNDYGYIRGTEGVDGDHIDVFLSDTPESGNVYVVDQVDENGEFDEHKVMYGFSSEDEAVTAYLANYSPGWKGMGAITEVSKEDFRKWIDSSHRKTKPFAEYKPYQKPVKPTETNGYKIGDKVIYKGGEATIYDFGVDGRPVLDTGMAPVIYEIGNWDDISPINPKTSKGANEKGIVENSGKKKTTSISDNVKKKKTELSSYGANNKIVSSDRYEELKKQMREKLNQLNAGFDPEMFAIGAEMAAYHIEAGAIRFADYAKKMIADMGDAIRPYLKSFYNGARDIPGMEAISMQMTPYEEVSNIDINEMTLGEDEQTTATAKAETDLPAQEKGKPVASVRKKSSKDVKPESVGDLFANENDVYLQGETIKQTENEHKRGSKTEDSGVGKETRPENGEPDRTGMDRSSTGSVGSDEVRGRRNVKLPASESDGSTTGETAIKNSRNNHNERGIDYAPKSPKARFDANVKAIRLMRKLIAADTIPDAKQMEILRKYSGWGGMGTFFNNEQGNEYKTLRELLSDEEFDAAANSINSAYYTPAKVIDSMWDIAERLGFKGGNILEGSAGIGNIIGAIPVSISERSNIQAVEIDPISGNILKLLYPDAKVNIQGFEETQIRNGSVDLAITNVPFVSGLTVFDKNEKDLSKKFRNIHDFCIAKNVRKLREGGIGIFITSSGTMDNSRTLREWLVNEGNADFIGAFRLNNKTFEGTNATSDIIVVRKRIGKQVSPVAIDAVSSSIAKSGAYETGETVWDKKTRNWVKEVKEVVMEYNNYFQHHPENMGGEMFFNYEKGETFRPGSVGLFSVSGKNQEQLLNRWVNTFRKLDDYQTNQVDVEETEEKEGTLFIGEDGNFYVSEMGVSVPLDLNRNKVKGYEKAECLNDYNVLKNALNHVLDYQVANQDDKGLEPLLKALNEAYDTFISKYGSLNKNISISFLKNDVDFPSVAAIEKYDEYKDAQERKVVNIEKTNVFKGRVIGFQAEPHPKTVKDGVIASIYKFGYIDMGYIADKLEQTVEQVKRAILEEKIGFVNPESGTVEVRYEYLSGNVRKKLEQARENNQNGEFTENIKALEKVVPMDIPAHLIDFSLGSSWIDPKLYIEYIESRYGVSNVSLNHVEGFWNMQVGDNKYNETNRSNGVYSEVLGQPIYATELVDAALNNRTIQVKKVITHTDKTKETIVDKEATQACLSRIDEIKDDFKEWMKSKMLQDEEIATEVARVYNDKFNNLVPKSIDEMFLPKRFGGASEFINLYTHQKRAVIRATTEPLLLAHEVGSGKTFTLISTAMEMKRLGTAKKPMIVVQNATVGQFVSEAKKLYPNARVLTLTDKDRTPEGRRAFYGRIKYSDWDMIIIPQSTFDMIPDSPERQLTFIQERIDEKQHAIQVMYEVGADEKQIEQLEKELADLNTQYVVVSGKTKEKKKDIKREEKTKQNVVARVKEQLDRKTDEVQYFDQMGIDAILIDEAHEYKRLGFSTAMTRGVKGIDPAGSKKAAGVYLKTRAILEQNGWKNVVFATGTPISNTAAEIWTFMKYLMPKSVMKENEIYYFDDFVRNFGNISQSLEFTTSGKFKENTRFAAYINKPELIRLWASVSDTVLTKEIDYVNDKIPKLEQDKHQDVFLPQSDSLVDIMNAVREELERFENMSPKEKRKNSHIPLVMYGIAKRAAIDTRLVDANSVDEPLSKTNKAVEETLKSLKETESYKGTVAIFCDSQRRWDGDRVGFDLFEDIRQKLIAKGVPANQIVVMKAGMSIPKKEKIFADVNAGTVRVIIGNTQTLGTGVNIQERLHTLIHMDAPDRPMDYTQRNGRILRQGNLHKVWDKSVRILRFGVEDSLDVTSYQRLKTKASFIDSIMDGKAALANNQENRTLEEEEEGLFDNPVAILSGSQYALLKNAAEREYRKFLNKKKMHEVDQIYIANRLARNKGLIAELKKNLEGNEQKLALSKKLFPNGTVERVTVAGKVCRNENEIEQAFKELVNKPIKTAEDKARNDAYFDEQTFPIKLKLDNVDATIYLHMKKYKEYDYKLKAWRIIMRKNLTYDIPEMGIKDYTASGQYPKGALEDILANVVNGSAFADGLEILQSSVSSMQEENKLLEQRKGKPFEYDRELKESEEKVTEYTELMKKELQEKEAKYAGRGNNVSFDVSSVVENDEVSDTESSEIRFRTDSALSEDDSASFLEEASRLNLPVTVYTSIDDVPAGNARKAIEKGLKVKGWYQNGHIYIYLPNATGMNDVMATLLHEGVAHYGLRQMVGDSNFNKFLDGVFSGSSKEIRQKILELAPKYNYNIREATEEYLASMAEVGIDNPTFWDKLKQLFRRMLESVGYHWEITDNDLRYLLWESYNRLRSSSNPVDIAKETAMRSKLNIGLFSTNEGIRFRFEERPAIIREYDEMIDSNIFRFQEAFQDSMLSLKVLQDIIERKTGRKARTFEDAYMAENRLSSVNKVDNERYLEKFYNPLVEEVKKLSDKYGRESVEEYIYAKSGLERNEVFLHREAQRNFDEAKKELDEKLEKNTLNQTQYDVLMKSVQETYDKTISEGKDYAGLEGLVLKAHEEELNEIDDDKEREKKEKEIRKEYKSYAENTVRRFEEKASQVEIDALWQHINDATHETLNKQLECGMISAETYQDIKGMMQYYVPMKGWEETIAEDVYQYTRKESPVKKEKAAKGRKSLADNPIAMIALSAQNAIILGNRNKMKQRFFNFVINRPNELAVISDVWYARTIHTVHGQVERIYPEIDVTDNAETIQKKLEDFEVLMKEKEAEGLAYRGKVPFGMELKTKSGQKPEHMVSVMINGKEYVIYINGNPRAAQALNGKTNPEGEENIFWEFYNKAKRFYGGGLTSNNPDFVAANLVRDTIHSATMEFMNKGLMASLNYLKNIPGSFYTVFRGVRGQYDSDKQTDVYFQEFINNGGETGYTAIHTIEDYKKEYERILNEVRGMKKTLCIGKDTLQHIIKWLETANRIAEDVNRFNAYMSSRKAGKSIEESIDAAKSITVNFNKKGSLSKGKGAWAALAWFMNKWILFFNPAIQGLYQVSQTARKNKKRVESMLGAIAASGFVMPYFNSLLISAFGGDGDDDYFNQTDYTRMNNWLLFVGEGYVKIPLPPFFREVYGLGDIFYRIVTGRMTPEKAAISTLRQVQSAIGFINLIPEGEPNVQEAVSGLMPDLIAPLMDVAFNRDFTGRDIAKDAEYTRHLPEYERIYKGVSPVYIEFSRMLNEIGGDEARRSPFFGTFINPAYMEHLVTGYTGGIGKSISNSVGMAIDLATGNVENIDFRSVPVVNRFGNPVTDRTVMAAVNRVFYDYVERYEAAKLAEKRYRQFVRDGRKEFKDDLETMADNGELEFIRYFNGKMRLLRKKQNLLKDNPDNKKLEKEITELKSQMIMKSKQLLK